MGKPMDSKQIAVVGAWTLLGGAKITHSHSH
jgi:hypothetical protein